MTTQNDDLTKAVSEVVKDDYPSGARPEDPDPDNEDEFPEDDDNFALVPGNMGDAIDILKKRVVDNTPPKNLAADRFLTERRISDYNRRIVPLLEGVIQDHAAIKTRLHGYLVRGHRLFDVDGMRETYNDIDTLLRAYDEATINLVECMEFLREKYVAISKSNTPQDE